MTTAEAIDYLERCADGLDPDFDKAVSLAVAALRAQQERENPEPLTLEELREMDGEPVRVVYDEDALKTTPGFDPLAFWALVEVTEKSIFLTNNLGGRTVYAGDQDLEWAGITAYRHKPKEETK